MHTVAVRAVLRVGREEACVEKKQREKEMLSRGLQQRSAAPTSGVGALPTGESVDWRREAALARHQQAMSFTPRREEDTDHHLTRAQKVQRYQDLVSGEPGSLYAHADYRTGGGTQIGGGATQTNSMTADFDNPSFFKNASTILSKGAPAIRGSLDPTRSFRLA